MGGWNAAIVPPAALAVVLVLAGPAVAVCEAERLNYSASRDTTKADLLIGCLDLTIRDRGASQGFEDGPVVGVAEPGTPTYDGLQRKLEDIKRLYNVTDENWSALMTETVKAQSMTVLLGKATDKVTIVATPEAEQLVRKKLLRPDFNALNVLTVGQ